MISLSRLYAIYSSFIREFLVDESQLQVVLNFEKQMDILPDAIYPIGEKLLFVYNSTIQIFKADLTVEDYEIEIKNPYNAIFKNIAVNTENQNIFVASDVDGNIMRSVPIICYGTCSTCFDTSSQSCNGCKPGLTLVGNYCECQQGFYDDGNGKCVQCSNQNDCQKCDINGCLTCKTNRTIDNINKTCKCLSPYIEDSSKNCILQCDSNCKQCDSNGNCSICDDSLHFISNSGKCECEDGYYKDKSNQCIKCSSFCLKCDSNGDCNICDNNLHLISKNGKCVCEDGYYKDTNNLCQKCNSTCQTCSDLNLCTSCDSINQFRELSASSNKCICLSGFNEVGQSICLKQQTCSVQNCKVCGSQPTICSSCDTAYYLHYNACVKSCSSGYYANLQNVCVTKISFIISQDSNSNNSFRILFGSDLPESEINQYSKYLKINIPSFEKKYKFTVEIITKKEFKVNIQPNSVPSKQKYKIIFEFDSNQNLNLIDFVKQLEADLYYEASESLKQATEAISGTTKAASQTTIASLLPLAISGNFQFIASAVDISQLIYLMNFINIDYPFNLDSFFDSLKDFKIPFINFFEIIEDYDKVQYNSPSKFESKEISGFYLNNFGDSTSLILTILMCNFIVILIETGLRIKPSWQAVVNKLRNKIFNVKFYFELLWVIYLDMTVALILQVQVFEFDEYVSEVINYILMLIGLFISIVPICSLYLLYKEKFPHLFEAFTDKINFKYYMPIQYLRKLYFSIFICAFNFSPLTQILSLIIWDIFMIILIWKTKPNESKLYNIRDIISNSLLLCSTILLVLFQLPFFSDQDKSIDLGWIIIAVLCSMIIIELGFFVKETICALIDFLKKAKRKISSSLISKNKVVPLSPLSSVQKFKINEIDLQNDDTNTKPCIKIRRGSERPYLKKNQSKISNSTNDPNDKIENSFMNTPTKLQLINRSPQQSIKQFLQHQPSSITLKDNAFLKPPSSPNYEKILIESQSLDINSQNLQESSQKIELLGNKGTYKDLTISDRNYLYSPEQNKMKSLLVCSGSLIDKSINGLSGSELPSFIQNSEILKQFSQLECQTQRKRSQITADSSQNTFFQRRRDEKKFSKKIQKIVDNLIESEKIMHS